MDELDLQGPALVGFSMRGGEVARYLFRHGAKCISKAVLISSVVANLLKDDSNPDGIDPLIFEDMKTHIRNDRFAFLRTFAKMFYSVG